MNLKDMCQPPAFQPHPMAVDEVRVFEQHEIHAADIMTAIGTGVAP
jgi:hypothetical protein